MAKPSHLTREQARALTLLAVDWGERRIGLALKPAGQDWAVPSRVLTVKSETEAIGMLREAIAACRAQGVVVGLPIHGNPTQANVIRRFCRKARSGQRGTRWFFVDERMTSEAADAISVDSPSRRPTDDLAATLILETFLQTCP